MGGIRDRLAAIRARAVPKDEEQKAADEGRVTEAQRRANEELARQVKEREARAAAEGRSGSGNRETEQ